MYLKNYDFPKNRLSKFPHSFLSVKFLHFFYFFNNYLYIHYSEKLNMKHTDFHVLSKYMYLPIEGLRDRLQV